MDRASKKLPAGALVGAVLVGLGSVLPHAAARASMPTDATGAFSAGLSCGPAETLVGAGAPGPLARVRADAASRRAATEGRRAAARPAPHKAARPPASAAPRAAKKPPQAEQEPRPVFLRSFYTCNAPAVPNFAEGTGWRLVGPLRQG